MNDSFFIRFFFLFFFYVDMIWRVGVGVGWGHNGGWGSVCGCDLKEKRKHKPGVRREYASTRMKAWCETAIFFLSFFFSFCAKILIEAADSRHDATDTHWNEAQRSEHRRGVLQDQHTGTRVQHGTSLFHRGSGCVEDELNERLCLNNGLCSDLERWN